MDLKSKDTLSIVQAFAKFGHIFSQVLMIVSIVIAAFCFLGIISLAIGIGEAISILGVKIHGLIESESGMATGEMIISMITGMVMCAAAAVNSGFAKKYFTNELEVGTPFTFDGAKEMLRLGIVIMSVSLGASMISGIVEGIVDAVTEFSYTTDIDIGDSFSVGFMFIVLSFVCKYGAEVSGKEKSIEQQK